MVAPRNVGTALRPTPDETGLCGSTTSDRAQARTDLSSVARRTAVIAGQLSDQREQRLLLFAKPCLAQVTAEHAENFRHSSAS